MTISCPVRRANMFARCATESHAEGVAANSRWSSEATPPVTAAEKRASRMDARNRRRSIFDPFGVERAADRFPVVALRLPPANDCEAFGFNLPWRSKQVEEASA